MSDSILPLALAEAIRSDSPNWPWRLRLHWCLLDRSDRVYFFDLLGRLEYSDGFAMSTVQRAYFFMCVWNVGRFWDVDAEMARGLLLAFHGIEDSVDGEVESEFVASIKLACPYLAEIDDQDINWTGYRLPVEIREMPNPDVH
jgi:hypothetical protein